MNMIFGKKFTKFDNVCTKFDNICESHPCIFSIVGGLIGILCAMLITGYVISYETIDWLTDFDDDMSKKDLSPFWWFLKWFGVLMLGTAFEVLVLLCFVLSLYLIFSLIQYGYMYIIPLGLLFGGLYLGRKMYLKKRKRI